MIIRGGTIVTARGVERADIVIADGRIVEVGANLDESGTEIDAKGLHAFPGGIDSHVHLNEPGRTEWEDIAHGTAALAAGGYTAFVDMPLNNLPVTTTVDALDLKLAAMRRWAKIDYGFTEAHTAQGNIGIKVWINNGEYDVSQEGTDAAHAQAGKVPKKSARPSKR